MLKAHIETLRRSAETTMHTLVRKVFSKLHDLDPEEEETKLQAAPTDEENDGELRMSVTPKEVVNEEPASSEVDPEQAEISDNPAQKIAEETLPPPSPVNRPECTLLYLFTCHPPSYVLLNRWFAFDPRTFTCSGQRPRSQRSAAYRFYSTDCSRYSKRSI